MAISSQHDQQVSKKAMDRATREFFIFFMEEDLSGMDFSGYNLNKIDMTGINLSGTNLKEANLSEAILKQTDLSEAILIKADVRNADLSEAILSGADLSEAMLYRVNLSKADLYKTKLIGANLIKAILNETILYQANLSEATLYKAELIGANLRMAILNNADLREANLSEADLRGADLRGADLSGAKFRNTIIDPTTQIEPKWQQLISQFVIQDKEPEVFQKIKPNEPIVHEAKPSKTIVSPEEIGELFILNETDPSPTILLEPVLNEDDLSEPILNKLILNEVKPSKPVLNSEEINEFIPNQSDLSITILHEPIVNEVKPSKPFVSPEEIDESSEFYEGATQKISINKYERNLQARKKCIEHYGIRCVVCEMSFKEKYGDLDKDFIHVHHLKPLNEIRKGYKIDPIKDLRPVCPNCHAVIHMRTPVYSIEEVKAMLKKAS